MCATKQLYLIIICCFNTICNLIEILRIATVFRHTKGRGYIFTLCPVVMLSCCANYRACLAKIWFPRNALARSCNSCRCSWVRIRFARILTHFLGTVYVSPPTPFVLIFFVSLGRLIASAASSRFMRGLYVKTSANCSCSLKVITVSRSSKFKRKHLFCCPKFAYRQLWRHWLTPHKCLIMYAPIIYPIAIRSRAA